MSAIARVLIRLLLTTVLIVALVPGLGSAGPRSASRDGELVTESADVPSGDVLVRFRANVSSKGRAAAHASAHSRVVREFDIVPGLVHVRPEAGRSAESVLRSYRNRRDVVYAESDAPILAIASTPNDPRFGEQWPLENTGQTGGVAGADIRATEVWDDTVGSRDVLVAVADSGVNWRHEDLSANVWTNPGEIAGNAVDDDGNGYVDDVHGWDFTTNDSDPSDQMSISHGTHVAGIIGAEGGNAKGVSGVSQRVSILPVRALDANGMMFPSNLVAGIQYADLMGADVINFSLAWTTNYTSVRDAIAAFDGLAVCAAGNNNRSNDVTPMYPASHDLPNILAVGATTDDDVRASYSNWGTTSVDVFAPGDEVLSTVSLWDAVWSDDMTDLSGWDASRYLIKPWSTTTMGYISAPSSAGHMGYSNNESSYLIQTTPVDLTGLAYARLSFDLWLHTEASYDWVRVYASEDATITDADYLARYSGGAGVWYQDLGADLSKFLGKRIYLAFELRSDPSYVLSGAMIDDVTVLGGTNGSAYTRLSGTSMAAPHASGLAALLLAEKPSLTPVELRSLIMDGAEPLPALAGLCVTGARIDAMASRDLLGDVEPPVTTASIIPTVTGTAPVSVTLSATDDRSGVAWTRYSLDGAAEVEGVSTSVSAPGTHTIAFRSADVSGNVEATRSLAFAIATRYEETAAELVWSRPWSSLTRTAYFSGGTSAYIAATGAYVRVPFNGTGITWIGSRTTSAGKAHVYLDDTLMATVDLYVSPNQHQRVLWSCGGLPDGPHTLRIEATGTRNPKSIGYNVWVDAFDVGGALAAP